MKILGKTLLIFILLVIIFLAGCNTNNGNTSTTTMLSNNATDTEEVRLAKCIADNSVLYLSTGCVACTHQEKLFGDSFKYLNLIDCKKQPQKCIDADILSVPTWIINGEKYTGARQIEQLKQLTGCIE